MAKPLNYYCDGSLIDELVAQYGSQLQELTRQQKLFLMFSVAGHLCDRMPGEDVLALNGVAARINAQLTEPEKESLLVALAHQVREQPKTRVVVAEPELSLDQFLGVLD